MSLQTHTHASWLDLTRDPERVSSLDIAIKNLACADGFPGVEVDQEFCLGWLDDAAEIIRKDTERRQHIFRKDPGRFNYSPFQFRVENMVTVLQRDLGVKYNPAKMAEDAWYEPEDVFIHGIIQGKGGTCASLPVLYVAVGRRLGFPLKLVRAKCHLFFRWDGEGERFNCEATNHGMHCPPDDYYRTGRYECTARKEADGRYFTSLSPAEEFGDFTIQRGWLWWRRDDYRQAVMSFLWGIEFAPHDRINMRNVSIFLKEWRDRVESLIPPLRPRLSFHCPRRVFRYIPLEMERQAFQLAVWCDLLNDPQYAPGLAVARCNRGIFPPGVPRELKIAIEK